MSRPPPEQSVILCEGYYDRAFWKGLLVTQFAVQIETDDPWGIAVKSGGHGYRTSRGDFLKIVPCGGDRQMILKQARALIKGHGTRPLRHLVLNMDSDVEVGDGQIPSPPPLSTYLEQTIAGRGLDIVPDQEDLIVDSGRMRISRIFWEAQDPATAGVPAQQTLERLACAAIIASYPGRGDWIQQWLDGRPERPPKDVPKAFAWSHMAGWYANRGCESFFEALWEDDRIAMELKQRLVKNGAWRVIELLTGDMTT